MPIFACIFSFQPNSHERARRSILCVYIVIIVTLYQRTGYFLYAVWYRISQIQISIFQFSRI